MEDAGSQRPRFVQAFIAPPDTERLVSETAALKTKLRNTEAKAKEAKRLEEHWRSEVRGKEDFLDESLDRIDALEEQVKVLNDTATVAAAEMATTKKHVEHLEGELHATRKKLEDNEEKLKTTEEKLKTTEETRDELDEMLNCEREACDDLNYERIRKDNRIRALERALAETKEHLNTVFPPERAGPFVDVSADIASLVFTRITDPVDRHRLSVVSKVWLEASKQHNSLPDVDGLRALALRCQERARRDADLAEERYDFDDDETARARLFERTCFQEAIEWWKQAAARGSVDAALCVGLCFHKKCYEDDFFVGGSFEEGFEDFYTRLGRLEGTYVREALAWYEKAAERGHTEAEYMAGLWYIGEDLDMANNSDEEVKGFRWLQKAAAKGHTKAEYMVGGCYHCGCGVEENRVDAVAWYRKAANKGYEPAFSTLDLMGEWEEDED
jgi:hypothetical protein